MRASGVLASLDGQRLPDMGTASGGPKTWWPIFQTRSRTGIGSPKTRRAGRARSPACAKPQHENSTRVQVEQKLVSASRRCSHQHPWVHICNALAIIAGRSGPQF